MFPLSPIYGNSAPVSPGTWRGGSVSPGGVSVALTSPEWAETCALSSSGVLERAWENSREGEEPSVGPAWGELFLPGVCAAGEHPAPFPGFMESGTSYIVLKPDVFQRC